MFVLLMGWAIVWVLDMPGPNPGPELVFYGSRGLVCNFLSLVSSTGCALSFEVGGLDHYVFLITGYLVDNFICRVMCRRAWSCGYLGLPRCSTPVF